MGLFSKRTRPTTTAEESGQVEAPVAPKSDVAYSQDYVSAHTHNWTEALRHLKGKPDVLGLEVGAFEGRSTRWFLENVVNGPRARLVVFDPVPRAAFHANISDVAVRMDYLREPSQVALRDRRWVPGSFDFAYIDGDHSARAVLEDSVLCWRLLKPGGVLIWDDYLWKAENTADPLQSPRPAIDAFLALHAGDYDVLLADWQYIIKRKV